MSRFGGPRASGDDLAYGDSPQRWDRDRFERFRSPPTARFEDDYRHAEREAPGRRDVTFMEREQSRGPRGGYEERDRYHEEDRFAPGRSRRRTDRELFGEQDPRELAGMALQPYRAPPRGKSASRQDLDIDIDIHQGGRAPAPEAPRPGMMRRQSSLTTFDRRPAQRYEREEHYPPPREEYRMPPNVPVPLPIRRAPERHYDHDFEKIHHPRYDRHYEPEDYREVEIQRERSVRRRGRAKSHKSHKSSKASRRSSSSSSSSSSSFERVEKDGSIHGTVPPSVAKPKKGKTRMPKRLVRREAIMDLGHPFDEEESFFMLRIALDKDQIDEVMRISEMYRDGEKKKVYKYEERVEEAPFVPPQEQEKVHRTEWINPPSASGHHRSHSRGKSLRGPSPSSASSITHRGASPARTHRSYHAGADFAAKPPPPPPAPPQEYYPQPPPPPPQEYHEVREPQHATHTHSSALVVQPGPEQRSDRDIQAEIAKLDAERRALRLEREAEERRDMAMRVREDDFSLVEYERRREPREVLAIEERERERSPPRNVVRVEKDRKAKSRARKAAIAMATLT